MRAGSQGRAVGMDISMFPEERCESSALRMPMFPDI